MKALLLASFYLVSLACLPILANKNQESWPRPIHEKTVIKAKVKTDDVATDGDAADDSAIFVNKKDPRKSLVIGTDKNSGVSVYNLSGKRIQEFRDGELNNIDLRYNFKLGDQNVALLSAGNRTTNTIAYYYIDEKANEMKQLSIGEHEAGIEIYGSCMYQSPDSKKFYVFGNSKDGEVVQWEVESTADKKLTFKKTREFDVGSQVEGCVVDDELKRFYIGEEAVGIWRYGAEPTDSDARISIDHTGEGGHLVADVEGLALYRLQNGKGYLLASSQGENAYNIYDRKSGKYIGKFQVEFDGKKVEDTDGIEVTSHSLGLKYPFGMIVVQDGNELNARQSFKFASWGDLAFKFVPPLKFGIHDPILGDDEDNTAMCRIE